MPIASFNRRQLLALAGTATAATLFGRLAFADSSHAGHSEHAVQPVGSGLDLESNRWVLPEPRKVRLATNLNAVCLAPVAVADSQGIFKRHNLDVEFVNFGNSRDLSFSVAG